MVRRAQLRALGALVLFSVACVPRLAQADGSDAWWGPDKALHFGVSAALSGGGYLVSTAVLDEPWQRASAAATLSLCAGAGKELYDLAGPGDASWKDFAWDGAGTLVGVGISVLVDLLTRPEGEQVSRSRAGLSLMW